MNCIESKFVESVDISLVLGVSQEQVDVLQVDILGGHMNGGEVEMRVEMSGAGPGLQQCLDIASGVMVVLVKSKV